MIGNFVQETANAPGNAATVTLAGPSAGRRGIISAFGGGATVYLGMESGTLWQVVEALTVAGPPQQITITSVISNSAGTTTRLNFTGVVRIYSVIPAERNTFVLPSGAIQGATATGDALFRAADAAAARAAIDAASASVAEGSWAGGFDLLTTDTSFFDIMLPANTQSVIGSGGVVTDQTAGSTVVGQFDVDVLNASLVQQARQRAGAILSTAGAMSNTGLTVGFNSLAAGNSGWRLRFYGRKSGLQGPFFLLDYAVRVLCVTR